MHLHSRAAFTLYFLLCGGGACRPRTPPLRSGGRRPPDPLRWAPEGPWGVSKIKNLKSKIEKNNMSWKKDRGGVKD